MAVTSIVISQATGISTPTSISSWLQSGRKRAGAERPPAYPPGLEARKSAASRNVSYGMAPVARAAMVPSAYT
mgnify:CR=1 FL=1